MTLKVCALADVECANPVSQGVTDSEGNVQVDIPSAPHFTDAYFEITGPNVEPSRLYVRYAEYAEERLETGKMTLSLLDSPTATALRGAVQATADQTTVGLVTASIYSCGQKGVPGVAVESSGADASTILEYLAGAAPNATATTTDSKGTAIFADHPEGPTTITAHFADTGAVLGSADLYVRAGFLNSIFVLPTQ